jgi:hypothetical protein
MMICDDDDDNDDDDNDDAEYLDTNYKGDQFVNS